MQVFAKGIGDWVHLVGIQFIEKPLDDEKCGKWLLYVKTKEYAAQVCFDAVKNGAIISCKYRNVNKGVICFFLDYDDMKGHKKLLTYLVSNNLIPRTKSGKLYNISFKLNVETRAGEYGDDFEAKYKLADFVNLVTGEWIR